LSAGRFFDTCDFPVFSLGDVDETRAWLRGKEFRFDLRGRQTMRPNVRVNGLYLPNMYLGYLQYGVQACACSQLQREAAPV